MRLEGLQPVGYKYLTDYYHLDCLPHFCDSYVAKRGGRRTEIENGRKLEVFRKSYMPANTPFGHIEFALKREGVNLEILSGVFEHIDPGELTAWIRGTPTGAYTRRVWYLYELLKGALPLPDLDRGNYVDLLKAKDYYTALPLPSRRHRVNDNLLGNADFCPMVRRTPELAEFERKALNRRADDVLARYARRDPGLVQRALQWFYLAETRSSYEIEREVPGPDRERRFMRVLQEAGTQDCLSEQALSDLQGEIVGNPRLAAKGYRKSQEYVASGGLLRQAIHLVPTKPADVPNVMEGLVRSTERMLASKVHPVVIAAAASFGFVYIHPFKDGNGRIHRYLIHHILAKSGFTPPGLCVPVSATMKASMPEYQEALNLFSKPLMARVTYEMDGDGHMVVTSDTARFYRYIDFTHIAERLFRFIEQTVDDTFVKELNYLLSYDEALRDLSEVIDGLPQRSLDLFIRLCTDQGRISNAKRTKFFAELTDEEIAEMEAVVRNAFQKDGDAPPDTDSGTS